jgi:hypothetical protein
VADLFVVAEVAVSKTDVVPADIVPVIVLPDKDNPAGKVLAL